jgi:coenzyme F420 hydrogenase subunit beta
MVREWPAEERVQSCVFKIGWLGELEGQLFGRERSVESIEETRFGISKERFIGRIKDPLPSAHNRYPHDSKLLLREVQLP